MLELYLIRHPETTAIENQRVAGHQNTTLKKGWEAKVDALTEKLAAYGPFDAIYAGDLDRTDLPASKLHYSLRKAQRQIHHPISYHPTPLLKERNFGVWEGQRYRFVIKGDKQDIFEYLFFLPNILNGESHDDIRHRVKKLREELQKYEEKGRLGIVSSNGFLNYLRNDTVRGDILAGGYRRMQNLEIALIRIEPTPEGPKAEEVPLAA